MKLDDDDLYVARELRSSTSVAKCHSRGFTLIEMMTVVVIVGILATLAVVGYRKIVQSSHVSEALNMVQDIRVAQESYHSETQQYANVTNKIPTSLTDSAWYPVPPVNGIETGWGGGSYTTAGCSSGCVAWNALPMHVDGPVLFGYATYAGMAGTGPGITATINGTSTLTFPSAPATEWYLISAAADLNGDGSSGTFTQVWADSFTNQVFVSNEGQ